MREVHLVHDVAAIPHRGHVVVSLVDSDVLAEDIAAADLHASPHQGSGPGGTMVDSVDLGRRSDDRVSTDPVVIAEDQWSEQDRVGADGIALAQGHLWADDR